MAPTMLTIGSGPGPKNVLVEMDDGTRIVVPYAIWKYKLKGSMSDKTYLSAAGVVQFDPEERDAGGQKVRSVTIRTFGSEGTNLYLTIWPDHADTAINKGDTLFVDGTLTERVGQSQDGEKKTYLNFSVSELGIVPAEPKREREVVNRKSKAKRDF
jgi:hypothetical protein